MTALNFTESNVFTVLGGFLTTVTGLPSGAVLQGQQNLVPQPSASDFIVMNALRRQRLTTNVDTWNQAVNTNTVLNVGTPTIVTMQADIYGPNSADNTQKVIALWRDEIAVNYFAASGFSLSPLNASEPVQSALIDGEEQYEDRWTVELNMQGNFSLAWSQQFANVATATLQSPLDVR